MNKRKTLRALLAAVSSAALLGTPAAGFAVAEEQPVTYALGDIDANGKIDSIDALIALQYAADLITLDEDQIKRGNVDQSEDGVTSMDALLILQYDSQYISEFPQPVVRTSGNPIFTDIFTADPSAHVWNVDGDDRLYVYASHDQFPARGCDLMDRYHIYSTSNMVDWYDHGEVLSSDDVEWGREEGGFMWAPDAAYKDGTYYYFFPHPSDTNWNDSWKIGVAASSKPAEDFSVVTKKADGSDYQGYLEGIPYDETGHGLIDPCVFEDTDGKFYLSVGGAGKCYIAEMTDDLLGVKPETWKDITEQLYYPGADRNPSGDSRDFHEGSWIFKRGDKYYLMYPDGMSDSEGGNRMRYAIADNVMGPYTAQAEPILGPVTDCDTTHGSIVEYKGEWYIFYHNGALSGAGNLRSVCVDKVEFNEDGTIKPVVQTTTGVPAIGPAETGKYAPNQTGALLLSDETIQQYKDTYDYAYDYSLGFAKVDVDMTKVSDDKCQQDEDGNLILDDDGNRIPKERPKIVGSGESRHTEMLTAPGAYLQFDGIIGGKTDGKALLEVHYGSADKPSFQVRSSGMEGGGINATTSYYMRMTTTGSWSDYSGVAYCLIDLKAGVENSIWLASGSGGANFTNIRVYLPKDNVDPDHPEAIDPTVVNLKPYTGPATRYTMENATVGTTVEGGFAPNVNSEGIVQNMHHQGAYVELANIDGGKGGLAMITVEYSSMGSGSVIASANGNTVPLGSELGFATTGDWGAYTGATSGLVDLNAGTDNVVRLSGTGGGLNIRSITITLVPQD